MYFYEKILNFETVSFNILKTLLLKIEKLKR